MTSKWLRRTMVLAACASAALLTACGSSTVDSAVTPTRIVSFGDALSDVGYAGKRYTINDGTTNIWAQQFAASYGRTLETSSAGGAGYARGNARTVPAVQEFLREQGLQDEVLQLGLAIVD